MNDWLLGEAAMQQLENAPHADLRGRFHNPARRDFGPPHTASTGAYLEGLVEAWRLARAEGDRVREARYRTAWFEGARHILQLQFTDDIDMFYVHQRERVLGGIRTEVYDNAIRIDNVQHALAAFITMRELLSAPLNRIE